MTRDEGKPWHGKCKNVVFGNRLVGPFKDPPFFLLASRRPEGTLNYFEVDQTREEEAQQRPSTHKQPLGPRQSPTQLQVSHPVNGMIAKPAQAHKPPN